MIRVVHLSAGTLDGHAVARPKPSDDALYFLRVDAVAPDPKVGAAR